MDELQLQAHRLHREKKIREDDGGVDVQNLYRLEGYLSRQVGPLANLEDTGLGADIPVLFHVTSGLPHKPNRPDIGGPAAASIQKSTVH